MVALHVAKDQAWHKVKDTYVARSGQWVKEKVRLVGVNGAWVESYSDETAPPNEFLDVFNLKYRAGGPLQGGLDINGFGLTDIVTPEPRVGAFYTFRGSLSDHLDNFAKLELFGTELPLPTLENGVQAYAFDATKQQGAQLPLDPAGPFDLLGLMGNDAAAVAEPRGKKHWEIGGKIKPKAMPSLGQVCFVYYSGTADQHLAVWFDSTGTLYSQFKNGTYAKALQIADAITVNEWAGFVFRHRPAGETRFLELQLHTGDSASVEADLPRSVNGTVYKEFLYWNPAPDTPIQIAFGTSPGAIGPASEFFLPSNTSASLAISGGGSELTSALIAYRGAMPSGDMPPNTGKYYIEIANRTSYDVHFGVTDAAMSNDVTPGQIGWCVNTISGRKFAKQTGGGTTWTSTIPNNSTIGLLYDSDQGLFHVYVDGVLRADPFVAGTITTTVRFIIGGRASTATTLLFNPKIQLSPSLWAYQPAGTMAPVPFKQVETPGGVVYTTGTYKDFYVRNAPMTDARTMAVLDPSLKFEVVYHEIATGNTYVVNDSILVMTGAKVTLSVPDLPEGNYLIRCRYSGYAETAPRLFTIRKFQYRTTPLHVDFRTSPIGHIRKELMIGHKQWGGLNGGIVSDNVVLNRHTGECEITALGDQYAGPIKGVDRFGLPSGFNTRIGGCVVTRDYFGPGSYRILCKPTTLPGACNAIWSFHYEEGYPGSVLFNRHLADGLHTAGNEVDGFYTVRNHEIDIEFPTALKTNPDQEDVAFTHARFNTWLGEQRNWDAKSPDYPTSDSNWAPVPDPEYWSEYTDDFVDHGVNLADGNFHELRYDWHLGDDPRVEFYIDGVLMHTVRTHVPDIPGRYWAGLWFPSASTHWAGRGADWALQTMCVKSIDITPFAEEQDHARAIVESYPSDVFRDFRNIIHQ
ncbi:hypothetical protein PS862_00250 [Pseudomonas fluorescens]|uniref:GH16 domain-containing protein n=1 Tax=Pseudomonas fluorescens TaxID=294 RepID=A0A5E7GLN7_PSEFL|nr:glycoside hydrolase family 16 protein [Pseudomonas fluorescens]VVO49773.1 hypothetical protein PS862_00250 [Pseudomonas fluorescens]